MLIEQDPLKGIISAKTTPGSERPASNPHQTYIGISNDIINNVYDSQLCHSMSVTCMLCPPITFNGDIYIGWRPVFQIRQC